MEISGKELKKTQHALIDAFPHLMSLEQMLAFELDKNLRAIAGEGSLQEIIFNLVREANNGGWIKDLIRAAHKSNPSNTKLKALSEELLSQSNDPFPTPLEKLQGERNNANLQMPLTEQGEKLLEALISAFPQKSRFEELLLFDFDKNLDAIAIGNNLEVIVFNLIKKAEEEKWIKNLIEAASREKPGNLKLQAICKELASQPIYPNLILNTEVSILTQQPKLNSIIRTNMDINEIIKQRLNERGYVIQNVLGVGGFGITYLTKDKINQEKLFVIKTIKNDLINNLIQSIKSNYDTLKNINRSIDSFRKEAQFLLGCKHTNIVKIVSIFSEIFELDISKSFNQHRENSTDKLELLFLVMEYIEGKNLGELVIERGSPLQEAEALDYIQQIGEALVVIHNKNFLHRDIKPQNIMVREATNDAVLIDFGIGRDFASDITVSTTVAYFTENYAPPEQRRKKGRRGNYTDIYGLAATLYYLLTKNPPIDASERQQGDTLVEPQEINLNISDRVNQAILWGMELEPSKRPQKVEEWLAELLAS